MNTDSNQFAEEKLKKRYDVKLLRRLFPFAARYKTFFFGSVLLVVLITLLELSLPYVTKITIDRFIVPILKEQEMATAGGRSDAARYLRVDPALTGVPELLKKHPTLFEHRDDGEKIRYDDLSRLSREERMTLRQKDISGVSLMALLVVLIALAGFFCNFLQAVIMELNGQKIMHDLRIQLFDHIQRLDLGFFNRNPVGRLVTRVTNDIQNMHEMFTTVVTFLFKDLSLLAGIALVLFSINAKLALVSLTTFPIVIAAAAKFADAARDSFRTLRIKVAEINTHFSETIQGMKVIHLFRQEAANEKRFQELNHENFLAGMRQIKVFAVFMPFIELMGSVTLAIIVYYGGGRVLRQAISLGDLVAFISYMRMFFRPLRDISEKFNVLQNALSSAERIFLILDRPRGERPGTDPVPPVVLSSVQSLEFRGVSFSYSPGEPILKDVCFALKAGETLAIVGPTGAGKTTLINLIIGFYPPSGGDILFNGNSIARIPLDHIRKRVALVSQDPFLFSGTVRENILPGGSGLQDKALQELLQRANCLEFIQNLPDGLDTILSEGAASLSSGERQLLSIARAFAWDPDVIILDEATSYIDSASEIQIQGAMNELMAGRTVILIAHRISTAQHADRIIAMHRGEIVESGTHQELMARQGLYFRLHRLQN